MSQNNTLESFDLILEDVSAEINLTINALEQYSRAYDNTKALKKSLGHLNKLKGVFTLLEMYGAQRLIIDVLSTLKNLPKRKSEVRSKLLQIVTVSLARLLRYSEHINQKAYDLPQLLLPTINELRASVSVPELGESVFFNNDGTMPREDKGTVFVTSEENAIKSRHYRQMYQIGLIEVIRQTNLSGGLKMMQKALVKLDEDCPRPQHPNLWWLADGLVECFIQQGLKLTKPRLKLFSRIDRQIRKVENKSENLLEDNKLEIKLLARELLYLVSISGVNNLKITRILNHFKLDPGGITDEILREEYEALRGPSDQDYSSIAEALMAEVKSIEKSLQAELEDNDTEPQLEPVISQMTNLNSLLKILQIDEQSLRLSVATDLLSKTQKQNQPLAEKDANIVFIALASLAKAVDKSELVKSIGNQSHAKSTLTPSKQKIRKETLKKVKRLMDKLTQFVNKNRKALLLKEVPQLIEEIHQGFGQLGVSRCEKILDGCQSYVNMHLMRSPHSTSENSLNLVADIIGSLEFYLDTLQHTITPSDRIFEFAENSLQQLQRDVA